MDILVHVPEYLLARVDEKIRKREFATRCQFITKAVRWYLEHLEMQDRLAIEEEGALIQFGEEKTLTKEP